MSPDVTITKPAQVTPTLDEQLAALHGVPSPAAVAEPSSYGRRILGALQGQHVYAGTVDPAVVARRRAKAKAARIARRANR